MKVLVDIDNLDARAQREDLTTLADRILSALPASVTDAETTMHFRIYGGWDRNGRTEQRAQRLSAEIRSQFPRIRKASKPLRITMELAQATEAYPQKVISNTLRTEALASGIHFQQPTKIACRNGACPIEPLFPFFRDRKCPEAKCLTAPRTIASQTFQKMVDTMLVADLIYNAFNGEHQICLVSGDDDMWPGIHSALRSGASVIHVLPRFNGASQTRYLPNGVTNYQGVPL